MCVMWGKIVAYRTGQNIEVACKPLENFLLKYFQQVKGLLSYIWTNIVLEEYYNLLRAFVYTGF